MRIYTSLIWLLGCMMISLPRALIILAPPQSLVFPISFVMFPLWEVDL